MLSELWFILISTVLVNNLVLTQFLGMDPTLSASRSLRPTLLLCAATSVVLLITCSAMSVVVRWLPIDSATSSLVWILGVLVTAVAAAAVDRLAHDLAPLYRRGLGHHLPLLFCNSAIVGAGLLMTPIEGGLVLQLGRIVATMVALTLVMIVIASTRARLAGADVPDAFEGIAITVMTLGLLSLAFTGFTGMAGV